MLRNKVYFPLLFILRKIPPGERQILLSHFDKETCKYLRDFVAFVLQSKKKISAESLAPIEEAIKSSVGDFEKILTTKCQIKRRKHLSNVGGGSTCKLLSVGIPLLAQRIGKKK